MQHAAIDVVGEPRDGAAKVPRLRARASQLLLALHGRRDGLDRRSPQNSSSGNELPTVPPTAGCMPAVLCIVSDGNAHHTPHTPHTPRQNDHTDEGWRRDGWWERVPDTKWEKGLCWTRYNRTCADAAYHKIIDLRTGYQHPVEDTEEAFGYSCVNVVFFPRRCHMQCCKVGWCRHTVVFWLLHGTEAACRMTFGRPQRRGGGLKRTASAWTRCCEGATTMAPASRQTR